MINILVDEGEIFYDDNMYEEIPYYESQAAIDGKLTASRFRITAPGSKVDKSHEECHMHTGSKFVGSYIQDTPKGISKIYLFQQYFN